jgi:hypothetical protein
MREEAGCMGSNAKILERGIRRIIKPEMMTRNFSYDSANRTFRRPSGECIQIVDFQIGVRTMTGKFTANLAVFHPEYREPALRDVPPPAAPKESDCLMDYRCRLAVLRDTVITKYFRKRIHNADTFWKWWLVTPTDHWWSIAADDAQIVAELATVRELLLTRGLGWLEQNSNVALLKAAYYKRKSSTKCVI